MHIFYLFISNFHHCCRSTFLLEVIVDFSVQLPFFQAPYSKGPFSNTAINRSVLASSQNNVHQALSFFFYSQ